MNIKSLPVPGMEQLQQWGPKLASALLVIAISYALTQLVWQLSGRTAVASIQPQPVSKPQSGRTGNQAEQIAGSITAMHLFGQADVQAGEDVISAPETKLNLELLGILAIGEKSGLAIIAGGGRDEQVYKVGDKIPGNVTLKAVYADRVLLESTRGLETLMLPKEADAIIFTESGKAGEPQQTDGKQAYLDQGQPVSVTPEALGDYRRRLSHNPAEIQKMANVSQATENGKVIGYKLQPGSDSALYKALGLKDGDVVTSVNGIDLTKPENGIRAIQRLRRAKQINATILRDGQEIQISHSLDK